MTAYYDLSACMLSALMPIGRLVIRVDFWAFVTDFLQQPKDVSGAANSDLADPEKSKRGEGVKGSAKIEVSHVSNWSLG